MARFGSIGGAARHGKHPVAGRRRVAPPSAERDGTGASRRRRGRQKRPPGLRPFGTGEGRKPDRIRSRTLKVYRMAKPIIYRPRGEASKFGYF
jgi:hypothetical protein